MAWNAVFPTGQTLISQSVTQIQANWAFINTFANTDHYFNVGGANEGHHRFSQYVNQAGDPALTVDGVIYVKPNNAASMQPYYRNSTSIRQIPMIYYAQSATGGPGPLVPLFDMSVLQQTFSGVFTIYNTNNPGDQGSGTVVWNGATAFVTQTSVSGNLVQIAAIGTTFIGIKQNSLPCPWQFSMTMMFF